MSFLFLKLSTGIADFIFFLAFAGMLNLSKTWFLLQSSALRETLSVKSFTSAQDQVRLFTDSLTGLLTSNSY